ncbi:MAG: hypothetical protein AAGA48_04345 [Myxococcota bacterium]
MSVRMCSIVLGLLLPVTASATTLIDEDFGDDLTATCSSAWVGDCEFGWSDAATPLSFESCGNATDDGVLVTGDSTTQRLFRQVSLPFGERDVTLAVTALAMTGTPDVSATVRFLDASGSVLATANETEPMTDGDYAVLTVRAVAPAAAVSMDASVELDGNNEQVWITGVEATSETLSSPEGDPSVNCPIQAADAARQANADCFFLQGTWFGSCVGDYIAALDKCRIECEGTCRITVNLPDDPICTEDRDGNGDGEGGGLIVP